MATIRDVAKKAGVSIATVSKVLRNDKSFKVTEKTRASILEAVEILNYKFVSKEKVTSYSVGIIMPKSYEYYTDPFFSNILQSLEKYFEENNTEINVIIHASDLYKNINFADETFYDLYGLIIMEELSFDLMRHLSIIVKHIVTVDFVYENCSSVGFCHSRSNLAIMNHLISCGYKKIAFISGTTLDFKLKDSLQFMMYRESLLNAGLTYNEDYIKNCYWDINKCAQVTQELLDMPDRPDAIFVASDYLASVTLGVIFSNGLSCPTDIGVVGFNNIKTSQHFIPPLTTVSIPTDAIGYYAGKKLLEEIKNPKEVKVQINLPFDLIIRNSTRKV